MVGLNVDFVKQLAINQAFSLYASKGFLRWWFPCENIYYVDFAQVEKDHEQFTMASWINMEQDIKERFGNYTGFCMVKLWPDDDFHNIVTTIQIALLKQI